jgi:hypothetical protein
VAEQKRRCPTCGHLKRSDEFYPKCGECKTCKKGRSRHNRTLQARKIAAFERFVDVLINLADATAGLPAERKADPREAASEAAA